ncbi:MAG: hypothetical protein J0M30_03515 [Chitinophagales bacterium]|nr:hypothetical protein [Chitinophagales bacterium]
MKKTILALVLMFTMGISSVFAGEEAVSPQVLTAFKSEFASAKEVNWTVSSRYYKAAFSLNGQRIYAYYSLEGQYLGMSRNLTTQQLPLHLMSTIQKTFSNDHWVTDLFELSNEEGNNYYLTLESADFITVLKSNGDNWTVYEKKRKS